MGEMYMPDSPNGGYRPLPKREFIVKLAEDGDRSLSIVRPEDVREAIVRCKDCKYRADRGRRHYCDAHAGGFFEVTPDDFCSWGVARDGA